MTGRGSGARTRWPSSCSVGPSAQCRSSKTSTSGAPPASSASRAGSAGNSRRRGGGGAGGKAEPGGRAARQLREQGGERVEQPLASGGGVVVQRRLPVAGRAELGQQAGEVRGAGAETLGRPGERRAGRPAAQHLEHGLVGARPRLVETAVEDHSALGVGGAGGLGGEPRLADARLARE